MATYPTLPTADDSAAEPVQSRAMQRATNGALKARLLHPTEKLTFTLNHLGLTPAQKTALDNHYSGDKAASFAFTWAGTSYTVVYAARPAYRHYPSGYVDATVLLEEV